MKQLQRSMLKDEKQIVKKVLAQKDECPKPKLQAWKRTRTTSKGRDPHIPDLEMDMNNVQGEK